MGPGEPASIMSVLSYRENGPGKAGKAGGRSAGSCMDAPGCGHVTVENLSFSLHNHTLALSLIIAIL